MTYDNGGYVPPRPPQYPYPQFQPPPPPPPRRRPVWPWVIGVAVAAVVVLVAGLVAVVVVLRGDDAADSPPITVVYEVTGPGSATIDYWGEAGGREIAGLVPLPWRAEVTIQGEKPFVSVSAVRERGAREPLRCRITADGRTVSEDDSVNGGIGCDGYLGEQ